MTVHENVLLTDARYVASEKRKVFLQFNLYFSVTYLKNYNIQKWRSCKHTPKRGAHNY